MKQSMEKPTLLTEHLVLTFPSLNDLKGITEFELRNKNHLANWESTISSSLATQKRLEDWIKECETGLSTRFLIRSKASLDSVIGFCNFTQFFHGPFQACYLGYKIDHEYEGKGFMFEALKTAIQYIFEELKMNRIMANYMPTNIRSAKLLNRLGFEIEGYAKNYLLINNRWEDHILTAMSKKQWLLVKEKPIFDQIRSQTTQSDLIFREVQISDTADLVPLLDQLGYPIDEKTLEENIQKYLFLPTQKAWVAESGRQIIGCIAVATTHYFHRQGSFLRVIAIIVNQKHRRGGIGKTLIGMAEKFGREQGCSHIELTSAMHRETLGSHKFYQSLGYSELNEIKKYFAKKLE